MYNKLEFTEEISIPIATTTATTKKSRMKPRQQQAKRATTRKLHQVVFFSESMNEWEKLAQK